MVDVLDLLKELVPGMTVRRRPGQRGDARDTAADIRLAGEQLGYRPTWGLEKGLREQVRWHEGRERWGTRGPGGDRSSVDDVDRCESGSSRG
jgi:nucleoside-diphosphate-sugar epimerase